MSANKSWEAFVMKLADLTSQQSLRWNDWGSRVERENIIGTSVYVAEILPNTFVAVYPYSYRYFLVSEDEYEVLSITKVEPSREALDKQAATDISARQTEKSQDLPGDDEARR